MVLTMTDRETENRKTNSSSGSWKGADCLPYISHNFGANMKISKIKKNIKDKEED